MMRFDVGPQKKCSEYSLSYFTVFHQILACFISVTLSNDEFWYQASIENDQRNKVTLRILILYTFQSFYAILVKWSGHFLFSSPSARRARIRSGAIACYDHGWPTYQAPLDSSSDRKSVTNSLLVLTNREPIVLPFRCYLRLDERG